MKKLPFNLNKISEILKTFPTPFHLYDEAGIRQTSKHMSAELSVLPGYKNYYAVKALPNPAILNILKQEGMGVDCSSLAELILAEKSGFSGMDIMFTSNDTTRDEYRKAAELGAIINLDDITHIEYLENTLGTLPELVCFRYNPGSERSGNAIIGKPEEAKYGLTRDQIFKAYETCKSKGVKRFGLHTMMASNELDPQYFIDTAEMLFKIAIELSQQGVDLDFINLGGGFGIPYLPDQTELDLEIVASGIKDLYDSVLGANNLSPSIVFECGRYVTGPHGYLISTAIHTKSTYREYVGLDSSMADLMRPGMYGAYHHVTVLGKENQPSSKTYDITGSLCENNDKFAVQRLLPEIEIGDIIVIHDTGAHGHAMGFNYNGKLRSAELLLRSDGSAKLIRRAETLDDYFSTLNF